MASDGEAIATTNECDCPQSPKVGPKAPEKAWIGRKKERAVSLLRRYRQAELSEPKHYSFAKWTMYEFGERSYTRSVVDHLIERIKRSPDEADPLTVVHDFICWIDTICKHDNHPIKNEFVKNVIRIADNLEQYLWEAEINYIHEEDCDVSY